MPENRDNTLPTGYILGDYTIEAILGKGGFGITYLASDEHLGTRVAIKEYYPSSMATRGEDWIVHCRSDIDQGAKQIFAWGLKQFLIEARALGKFKHHNIVRVLRFLEANGTAYMVMEYEAGQSLGDQLLKSGNPLDQATLLQIFIPILNGLQAVHVAGLLHRDIKPDNIYLRTDQSPMLIDFGSVRPSTQDDDNAQPTALTPAFAALEQYPNQGKEGPWTDVYSIGASMYRCATGRQPISSIKRYDAIRTYKPDPLIPLSESRPDGYADFVVNCIDWAMQSHSKDRPKSARDLQDGLMGNRKSRAGAPSKPVVATVTPPAGKFVEQRPTTVDRWKIIRWSMVGLSLMAALAIYMAMPADDRQALVTRLTEEITAEPKTTAAIPGIKLGAFTAVRQLRGSFGEVDAVVFIPNTNQVLSASRGGTLTVWDINSGNAVATLNQHRHTVKSMVQLGQKSLIAAGDKGGNIFIWDPVRKRVIDRLTGHRGAVMALATSPNHKWLASAGRDGRVIIWQLDADGNSRLLASNLGRIHALSVSPDGKMIAAGSVNGDVYVISTSSGETLWHLKDLGGLVKSIAFSPDGRWLVAGGLSDGIVQWSARNGDLINKLVLDRASAVNALRFSRNSRWLFSGDTGGMVSVWDVDKGTLENSGYQHSGMISDLALTADGKTLVSASSDKTLVLWALN